MSEENRKVPVAVDFDFNNNLTCKVKCGGCLYFASRAHSKYKEPCSKLGILATNTPCNKFSADTSQFNFRGDKVLKILSKALSKIGKEHLPAIATILNREAKTRNKGFYFGEAVYVKAFGGDYLSNYRRAYVIYADRKLVHLSGGRNINSENDFTASIGIEFVLHKDQWEKKKASLIAKGLKKDPKLSLYTTVTKKPDIDYEPPTIDDYWKTELKNKKDKKGRTNFQTVNASTADTFDVLSVRG